MLKVVLTKCKIYDILYLQNKKLILQMHNNAAARRAGKGDGVQSVIFRSNFKKKRKGEIFNENKY